MKRLLKQSEANPHLSDFVDKITNIIICEDIDRTPLRISASDELDDDSELSDEQFYLTMTNEQLMQLPEDEIRTFSNVELIGRIAKVAPYKLSAQQLKLLKEAYKRKVVLSQDDVEKILRMLRQCSSISYENVHRKTNEFARDLEGVLREDDCLDIIHQLTIEDYVASSKSINIGHLGNNIIIFEPDADWETNDGAVLTDLKIYVKLDIDETTKTAVALISFHEASRKDDKYPYRTQK